MNQIVVAVVIASAFVAAGPTWAGKVTMPKEGPFAFTFCVVDQGKTMTAGEKVYVSHYEGIANVRTEPAGRPFDKTSATCYGTYANLNGNQQGFGVCEVVDQDGDKWWMEYHDSPAGGGGTYTSAHGTGKYDGMSLKGEYVVEFWPTAKDAAFQVCNANKGTYRLK
jgi:hypothetical protein